MPERNTNLPAALRLLAHFWLEEVRPSDRKILATLPDLGEKFLSMGSSEGGNPFTSLAVEYQRLFGFNLPPYESVYVDPSAMLNAPATHLIQSLFTQAGWAPQPGKRAGAPDHLGFELLALADWMESALFTGPASAQTNLRLALADQLLQAHLALWVPPFILALQRLSPHPFYASLGELTLGLLLTSLPAQAIPAGRDPFPPLPPAPIFRATFEIAEQDGDEVDQERQGQEMSLSTILNHLLTPREAGLYLTRQDLASIGKALELPGVVGERAQTLRTLFSLAGQYELLPELFAQLETIFAKAHTDYAALVAIYPAWELYAVAWQQRLEATRQYLETLQQIEKV